MRMPTDWSIVYSGISGVGTKTWRPKDKVERLVLLWRFRSLPNMC